jgi:imidazole glycerol-phosphate synthase subunit HisH
MRQLSQRTVGLIDYGVGNIRSIENALEHLGAQVTRVRVPSDLEHCSHSLLPGVGAFGFCATQLRTSGLLEAVETWALRDRKPLLGICVGMQLLADMSEESPGVPGLGWIGGTVKRIPDVGVRVPHVGWNLVTFPAGIGEFAAGASADFYFDHSFAYHAPHSNVAAAVCMHGEQFCAVVQRGNILAAQFHPEKSQAVGMRFLRGFLAV